jgi:hypothetical protein
MAAGGGKDPANGHAAMLFNAVAGSLPWRDVLPCIPTIATKRRYRKHAFVTTG